MAKQFEFQWQIPVPEYLQNGAIFDRWDEESGTLEPKCLVKVDEYGFFIYWKSEGREGQVLEISQVNDIRLGLAPKINDPKTYAEIEVKGNGSLEWRTVTVCSGLDLVNITYTPLIAADVDTSREWFEGLRKLTPNTKANNICPMTSLKKTLDEVMFDGQSKWEDSSKKHYQNICLRQNRENDYAMFKGLGFTRWKV